jgi:hypothetical protein
MSGPPATSAAAPPPHAASPAPCRLRAHHFLCAIGFEGKGYSEHFTANMARIVDALRAPGGEAVQIEVAPLADDICTACPKRRGDLCTNQAAITALDQRHSAALYIAPGDQLSWGEALEKIRTHVQPDSLSTLCAGCQWLDLGLCETALKALHAK